jgi:hypothetical protein
VKRPAGYDAAKAALINAIRGKRLAANVIDSVNDHGNSHEPDWYRTTIMVEDLRTWLKLLLRLDSPACDLDTQVLVETLRARGSYLS